MDAIKDKITVYFGGSYAEHWDRKYVLSVTYEDRSEVNAEFVDGVWRACGGDEQLTKLLASPSCPVLAEQYFQAAATVQAAVADCGIRGIGLDRLGEYCYIADNPVAAAEMMRCLMDEKRMSLEVSYQISTHCCSMTGIEAVDETALGALQPRTAAVLSLLRELLKTMLSVSCDSRDPLHRRPFGAVKCETQLTLGFTLLGGQLFDATLVLKGDNWTGEYEMRQDGDTVSVTIEAPKEPAPLWYHFRIQTNDGTWWLCPDASGYIGRLFDHEAGGFRLTVYLPDFDTPAWFRRSVMYQIFPDRFAFSHDGTAEKGISYHLAMGQTPELHASLDEAPRYLPRPFEEAYRPDDFYGGTFTGIREKLPYLKNLGVSCLYLNPIVESRSNHRYDTSDYFNCDPILGTNAAFQQLCSAAEEQGIRVILDGVFSHTGADSIYFNRSGTYPEKGACQGPESKYYGWYDFHSFPDDYRCWWGFHELPEVNEENPDWQEYVINGDNSVVKTWLRRGASGWRLDVADELPESALELIRRAVKAEKPDAPIIGEVWEDAVTKVSQGGRRRYALGYSLDSVMNYPLRQAVLDFAHYRGDAWVLRDFLIAQQMNYPKPLYYSLMNLLGSHDVERLRTALSTDVTVRSLSREEQLALRFSDKALTEAITLEKLCATLQFSLPGVPSVYYGDEQGMHGVCDPFNRAPFLEGDGELYKFYSELAAIRNSSPALSTGEAEFMAASGDVLAVLRYINNGRDALGEEAQSGAFLAVINRGGEVQLDLDCHAAGRGVIHIHVMPLTAEIIEI